MNYQRKYKTGDLVRIVSKASKNRGKIGKVTCYCKGRYPNICRVQVCSAIIRLFDTSLEAIPLIPIHKG